MLVSFKNTALLLVVLTSVLYVPGVMAQEGWENAEKNRRAKEEQDVLAEAAKRREAEKERWNKSAEAKQKNAVQTEQNAELEKMKAEVAAAQARAAAAEKAKAEAERVQATLEAELKALKSGTEAERVKAAETQKAKTVVERDKTTLEAELRDSKAETAAERARAEAAEKTIKEIEKSRNKAESDLEVAKVQVASGKSRVEAAEKARGEAERDKAQAEAERDKAKAEAERARAQAQAKAEKEADRAKNAERKDHTEKSVLATVGEKILWYIPNRLSDLMDIFTVEVGGGELGLDLQLTRYLTFGAGVGKSYMLGWSIFNQHGVYCQQGWYVDFLRYRAGDIHKERVCGAYTPFSKHSRGSVDIDEMSSTKAEDPYAIGVNVGCYLNFKFQIHVTELADFVAGLFFIDFKDDDRAKINWVF